MDSSLNTTSLECLLYEEGHRFTPALTSPLSPTHSPIFRDFVIPRENKSLNSTSKSAMLSPTPSPILSKPVSTQTLKEKILFPEESSPKIRSVSTEAKIEPKLKSKSVQHDSSTPKKERFSEPVPLPVPAPPLVQPYTSQPIYIQMPTYNTSPQGYPGYSPYSNAYPQFPQFPQYPQYSPPYPQYSPEYSPYHQYPQFSAERHTDRHEVPMQNREVVTSGIQTVFVPREFDSDTEQSVSLSSEAARAKAWANNYGSNLSPAEMLKRNRKLHKKLKERGFPHHCIFHDTRDEESLLRIRRDMIRPRMHQNRHNNKNRAITPRLEKLSMPKHS